jgi:radical SAM superfamily enzyme YgiQ (UPF0313 family)
VYPPITKFERYSSTIGSSGGQQIPLGVFYLASYLRNNGFETDVLDAEAGGLTYEDIIQRLQSGGFGILGISTTTVAFHRALELAEKVRVILPEMIIIVGGPHVSSYPTHPMEFDVFDFAVKNEGEETLVELMEAIVVDGNYENIRGLIYRRNGVPVVNEKRPYIEDVDALPLPAYDLISDFKYYTPPPSNYKKSPVANVITTRGCPNQCTFCDSSTFGQKTRVRSAENIVSEIELLMTRYSIREIAFVDDTFTVSPKRVYDIFDIARSKGLRFPWTCQARINTVNEDLLRYMKENGCWYISFGIESGNEQILKEIRKNIKIEDVERVIDICYRLKILTKGFFIVGHPLETTETIDQTINFARRLKLTDVVVTLNTPLPGSYQFQHAKEYGVLDDGPWSKFNMWNPVFVPYGLTKEILLTKHKDFYRRFYLRPRILWRYFVSFLSPTGLKRMVSVLSSSRFLLDRKDRRVG